MLVKSESFIRFYRWGYIPMCCVVTLSEIFVALYHYTTHTSHTSCISVILYCANYSVLPYFIFTITPDFGSRSIITEFLNQLALFNLTSE